MLCRQDLLEVIVPVSIQAKFAQSLRCVIQMSDTAPVAWGHCWAHTDLPVTASMTSTSGSGTGSAAAAAAGILLTSRRGNVSPPACMDMAHNCNRLLIRHS